MVIANPGYGVMTADAWLSLKFCPYCQQRTGIHDWHRLIEEDGTLTPLVWFGCPAKG
jgi:hypothetical protein